MVPPGSAPDPEFRRVFNEASRGEPVTFARFVELALYHPEVGYYRAARRRVGREAGTDFYTATSGSTVFGELVAAAARKLLGESAVRSTTFVEVGAEPDSSVLHGVDHGFAAIRTLRVGEPLELTGRCVVFSNELFDAQPFHRVVSRNGTWVELGVQLAGDELSVCELPALSPEVVRSGVLPSPVLPDGYHLDLPLASARLAETLAAQTWEGCFIAFDYGKSWSALISETPAGTARAYSNHRQSNDLLAQPGRQDLTCHVCWDWISTALSKHGFNAPQLVSQESFLLRHAAEAAARIATAEASQPTSARKAHLQRLLHPALQGQKFQVLFASRIQKSA